MTDSPRVPEAAQPEGLVGAPDKERPDAREEGRASLFSDVDREEIVEWRRLAWEHRDEVDSARIVALADVLLSPRKEHLMAREHVVKWSDGVLPLDCPNCGRRRLDYGMNADGAVVYVECSNCKWSSEQDEDDVRGERGARFVPGRWEVSGDG